MPMILNEEQNMLKDTAKDFCTKNAPIRQLRTLRDEGSEDGFDRDTWSQMVELGWAGIPFPETFGGLGFGYKGLGVVTEETGRTLTASPLFASVWIGGTLINIGGSDEQKSELLPQVSSGELLLAQGELPAAAEAFQRVLKLSPERQRTRMGQEHRRAGPRLSRAIGAALRD